MRIAVGGIGQESNTFVPMKSDLDVFRSRTLVRGDAVLEHARRTRIELSGFLDVLAAGGAVPVPLMAAQGGASGPLTRAAFNALLDDLLTRLRAAAPVDAVLLSLHGALVLEDHPDGDGVILQAVRETVGSAVPVAASLDLHGHMTPLMAEQADILVGYKKYPHTDMYETGVRTARLLLRRLDGEVRPVTVVAKRHLLLSPVAATTDAPPFRDLMDRTDALESAGRVLAASLFPVQPWLDIPDLGYAAVVVTDGDREGARMVAESLCDEAWQRRAEFATALVPLDEAIRSALAAPRGPVVIGDGADAATGGSAADNNGVLRALLARGADRSGKTVLLTLADAPAVAAACTAGAGAEITVLLGHTVSRADGAPLRVTGRVTALGNGEFTMTGPGMTGVRQQMGRTAVLAIGGVHVVLMERPTIEWDPALYRSVGQDPRTADVVFVKSPAHFRVSYEPFAAQLIFADTPGPNCCDMTKLAFRHVTRPLYPIDGPGAP